MSAGRTISVAVVESHEVKEDDREEPEWIEEDGIWVKRWPEPQLTPLERLTGARRFIPAGEIAITREHREEMAELARLVDAETKMSAVLAGAARGRSEGHETRRAAADQGALLAAVREHRELHPRHGRPAIAAALLPEYGRPFDPANSADRRRAIAALCKRIERAEKSLDS